MNSRVSLTSKKALYFDYMRPIDAEFKSSSALEYCAFCNFCTLPKPYSVLRCLVHAVTGLCLEGLLKGVMVDRRSIGTEFGG